MRLVDKRSPKLRKLQKAISLQKAVLKRDPEFRNTLKPTSETGSIASSSHKSKQSISTKASKKSENLRSLSLQEAGLTNPGRKLPNNPQIMTMMMKNGGMRKRKVKKRIRSLRAITLIY